MMRMMRRFLSRESRSFSAAFNGLRLFVQSGVHARIHLLATVLAGVCGCVLHIDAGEWLWLCACMALVWVAEIFNTCIEHMMDFLHPQKHARVKTIKDMSAGAVLVAALASIVVAAIIFLAKIF
jgi:diacylglycerol kinase